MTLEQLIEQKGFPRWGTAGGEIVVQATDVLAWAIEQMQQGNILPPATQENTDGR